MKANSLKRTNYPMGRVRLGADSTLNPVDGTVLTLIVLEAHLNKTAIPRPHAFPCVAADVHSTPYGLGL